MTSLNKNSLSKEYTAAIYACVSLLLLVLIGILFYVLCSKRYKLNWFEKANLAAAEEKGKVKPLASEAGSIGNATELTRSNATSSSVSRFFRHRGSNGSQSLESGGDWVPYDMYKEGVVRETAFAFSDERVPDTPLTPLGTKVSPFTIHQTGFSTIERGASPLIKYVQPPPLPLSPIRSRLTSMYTKLNHTQFDAKMYQSKVWLLPDIRDVRKSTVHRKTLNPHFEEDFVFDVPPAELRERTLEILIYDYDQYSKHVCMGKVQLPLDRIDLTEKTTLWKGITIYDTADDQPDLGDLMFSLGYLPSAERLTVVILKARNLVSADERKKISDPYVKVSLYYGGKRYKKRKTATQKGTLNPIFNEALTFNVTKEMLRGVVLEFSVMNDNILGQKENLGCVVIGPHTKGDEAAHFKDMLASGSAMAMWHSLMPPRLI
ncbi:synaptotagmin-5-like isoform X2 [Tachypleus tridentatus]|uniref:synaptotagmin-5-like isoform X2 n=1 Tax=Tachypleus tridentatus TaxID=6853 RepID=UPI003FD3E998